MYEIVFNFINPGTATEPSCSSSLAFGIYYLRKLQASNLLQSFPLIEDRGPLMEVTVAKILLKFGAAQATCRDDDDHITSQLFKSKKAKDLLRRMEPHLLMCVFNDKHSCAEMVAHDSKLSVANKQVLVRLTSREVRRSLAMLKAKPGQAVVYSAGIQMSKRQKGCRSVVKTGFRNGAKVHNAESRLRSGHLQSSDVEQNSDKKCDFIIWVMLI